ncbi:MAG: RnfH family protein [Pseudomonas sp.]|jgi:putative ubiquitin-RnfH superfamily antitoxin RatB of RatAB toxin-antitoxin module|uniref:RnfH family protein n=1 Tax=Pseudomonas sp. TaxID=306 RepID=UPI00120C4206|nr:RnfH family protein [Pseudomonas sp.]RZI74990.1 MAG: RnfH family protein [Pseudomonas sp.]
MSISVTLLCSPAARQTFEQALDLPEGATVSEAVLASGLDGQFPALDWRALTPGVWGKVVGWDRVLQQDDRLELCRALLVDPKVARRERFQRQGSRAAGLFARRREGGKAGY